MSAPHFFEIDSGYFGLKLVDEAAVGWLDTWQSPSGDIGSGIATTPILATLASYSTPSSGWSSTGWSCQITSAQISARASTRTITRKPTWCEPGATIPTPDETAFSADIQFYQDADVRQSLSLWLFENDTADAYVYLGFASDAPPTCVGKVRIAASAIGGAGQTPLESGTVSLQFVSKPLIERKTS